MKSAGRHLQRIRSSYSGASCVCPLTVKPSQLVTDRPSSVLYQHLSHLSFSLRSDHGKRRKNAVVFYAQNAFYYEDVRMSITAVFSRYFSSTAALFRREVDGQWTALANYAAANRPRTSLAIGRTVCYGQRCGLELTVGCPSIPLTQSCPWVHFV